jgi:magnesium transporter
MTMQEEPRHLGVAGASPAASPMEPELAPGCVAWIVELDFKTKTTRTCDFAELRGALAGEKFTWIDIEFDNHSNIRRTLTSLGLISEHVIEDMLGGEAATQLARYADYLHLVLTGCRLDNAGKLSLERVDIVMGARFLLTIHQGPRVVLDMVRREYHDDFVRFAQSPSFLLYEIWDNLTEHYVSVQKSLERQVERLQADLFTSTDDAIFSRVSEIGENLLHFRSVLMPARTVLTELSTRRSLFISEATQSFLANMVGTVERVLQDVLVDRDILSQSLNLYMSLVTHRTNRAMNKLTVISAIFLPLTFLCGVYGMNFEVLPELKWEHGYAFFWLICVTIATALVIVMRRNKLL